MKPHDSPPIENIPIKTVLLPCKRSRTIQTSDIFGQNNMFTSKTSYRLLDWISSQRSKHASSALYSSVALQFTVSRSPYTVLKWPPVSLVSNDTSFDLLGAPVLGAQPPEDMHSQWEPALTESAYPSAFVYDASQLQPIELMSSVSYSQWAPESNDMHTWYLAWKNVR